MSEMLGDDHTFDSSELPLDLLQLGLAAGYAPDDGDYGVLAALGAGVGMALRLLAPATDAAVLGERYQLFGEIARGGMGVILQGRDNAMGREVVFKVLREEHQNNPALRRRFIEEAQVSGRLQHPGVVPVYEIGRFDDRRPYFTMKLVQGRTLAALLKERSDPGRDLPRFLKVFEQICETIAYSHRRRVIHRDLKPSNIMVGEFGEVQVMDWGLAKVLNPEGNSDVSPAGSVMNLAVGDGQTHPGAVMGTFAYMAPEQARGEVDRLDERCDVFGLGAILCEILTGKPPYVGTDLEEVRHKAEAANLGDAYEWLERSGADAMVRKLARHCLAAEAEARPSYAGELTIDMLSYQSEILERSREAERTSAAAEARAENEHLLRGEAEAKSKAIRRAGRLRMAVLILILVCGGGGLWVWSENRESNRRAAIKDAESLYFQAVGALEHNRFDEAAEKINKIFSAIPDYFLAHVLLGDILIKQKKFEDAIAAYSKAAELQPETALAYSKLGYAYLEQGKVDDAIPVIRRAVELDAKDNSSLQNLGVALERQNKYDEAVLVFKQAIDLDPKNAEATFGMGTVLSNKSDFAGSVTFYRKAIDLKPDFAEVYVALGRALIKRKEYMAAAQALRKGHTLKPTDPIVRQLFARNFEELGRHFDWQGDFKEAVASFRTALEIRLEFPIHDKTLHWFDQACDWFNNSLLDPQVDDDFLAIHRKAMRHFVHEGVAVSAFSPGSLVAVYERQDRLGELLAFLEECRQEIPENRQSVPDWLSNNRRSARTELSAWIDRIREKQLIQDQVDQQILKIVQEKKEIKSGWLFEFKDKNGGIVELSSFEVARRCASPRWRLYEMAARVFLERYNFDPSVDSGYDFEPVRFLILAGCGHGVDAVLPNETERTRMRKQALTWLRASLKPGILNSWSRDPALAGVRDEQNLAKLPPLEREEWAKLWSDVAALRKKAVE